MRHLSSLVASSLVLAGVLSAQAIDHPVRYVARSLDSGYLDNAGATATVVFRGEVRVAGALNLSIYFDRTNLPSGSRLRLTSMHDGAIELFNGSTLAEYQNYSSWFNGDAVQVELIAGPHTTANRVMVVQAAAGEAFIASPATICGPTDDRQLSGDPRVAREGRTPSILPGKRASMFPDRAPHTRPPPSAALKPPKLPDMGGHGGAGP